MAAKAAHGTSRRRWTFSASRPHLDPGERYAQGVDAHTPMRNVSCVGDGTGVRMEDYAVIMTYSAPTSTAASRDEAGGGDDASGSDAGPYRATGDAAMLVVADGHGSVPVRPSSAGAGAAPRSAAHYVGGYECARIAARAVASYVDEVAVHLGAQGYTLGDMNNAGVHEMLADAFAHAQRRCMAETARGALVPRRVLGADGVEALDYDHESSSARRERRRQLEASEVDGAFFALLQESAWSALVSQPEGDRGRARRRPLAPTAPLEFWAHDKVLVPYDVEGLSPPRDFVVCYRDCQKGADTLAEYGTTLTAVLMVVRHGDGAGGRGPRAIAHVANAGDSDAYLFRREQRAPYNDGDGDGGDDDGYGYRSGNAGLGDQAGPVGHVHRSAGHTRDGRPVEPVWRPVKLTADHNADNADEADRLAQRGLRHDGHHFKPRGGPYASYGIAPTRSCGHTMFSLHGIVSRPECASVVMEPDDTVIVATDGLWGELGEGPAPGADAGVRPLSREDRSALVVAGLLTEGSRHAAGRLPPADESARDILKRLVCTAPPRRDNATLVVIGVSATEPTRGDDASTSKRQSPEPD